MSASSSIAHALGLRRAGREYTGACPCCGYKISFSVTERDGHLLIYCAAGGCQQRDLWAALRKVGLAPDDDQKTAEPYLKRKRAPKSPAAQIAAVSLDAAACDKLPPIGERSDHPDDKQDAIAAIWHRSRPIAGTAGEAYLRA